MVGLFLDFLFLNIILLTPLFDFCNSLKKYENFRLAYLYKMTDLIGRNPPLRKGLLKVLWSYNMGAPPNILLVLNFI